MNLYKYFFLSERDADIVGKSTSRDGQGFTVLWSEIGHRILPTLTEQTGTFSGFQVLISGLHLHTEYCKKFSAVTVEKFFFIWEQLCAFSVSLVKDDPFKYPLPGTRALNRLRGSYILSFNTRLLDNQLAGGVWGLYRGAAEAAGLVKYIYSPDGTHKQCVLNDSVKPDLSSITYMELLLDIIQKAITNEDGFTLPSRRAQSHWELFQQISELVLGRPDRKILFAYVFPEGSAMRSMAEEYKSLAYNADRRTFINYCSDKLLPWKNEFQDILFCENYLAVLANMFNQLGRSEGNSVKDVAKLFTKLQLKKLKEARNEYTGVQYKSTQGKSNQLLYTDEIDFSSIESVLRTMIDCHIKIAASEGRGFEPWIEIDNHGHICTSRDFGEVDEDLCSLVVVGDTWVHDYYLSPFFSLAGEVKRFI